MELATIVFMAVGALVVVFAAVAVLSSILGVRKVSLEPLENGEKRGRVAAFQEKLEVVNSR